jgi:hypothetical protein
MAVLCITVKCLQRTCLPRKSTEIGVDMLVEAHTTNGFGIYTCPRHKQLLVRREFTRFSTENRAMPAKSAAMSLCLNKCNYEVKGIMSKLAIKFWMCQKCGKMKDYH